MADLDYFALVRASRSLGATGFPQVRIALLADCSTQHLVPLLRVLFHRQGLDCVVYEAPFDAIELEAYNADSELYKFHPEVVIILNSVQALRASFGKRVSDGSDFIEETSSRLTRIWSALQTQSKLP